ncbi:MAG: hypothetical protein RLZZ361_624 [Cyanobacteriota bacterium]|jgi:hypothetical protein
MLANLLSYLSPSQSHVGHEAGAAVAISRQAIKSNNNNLPTNKNNSITANLHKKAQTITEGVGKTAKSITEGVTKTAIAQGSEAAKLGMKVGLEGLLHTTFLPINMFVNNLPGGPTAALTLLSPVTSWLSKQLEFHAKSTGIELPMKPKEAIEKLLTGEYHELSEEFTNFLTGFVEKAISPDIQKAFASGNPFQIAKATGTTVTDSLKGLMTNIQNTPGNPFLKPLKLLGSKLPFVNKLPEKFQPWAAGAGLFLFGGALIRLSLKFIKWLIVGAGGIAVWKFAQNTLLGGINPNHSGSLGRSGGGGLMNLIDMGSKALGMINKIPK